MISDQEVSMHDPYQSQEQEQQMITQSRTTACNVNINNSFFFILSTES